MFSSRKHYFTKANKERNELTQPAAGLVGSYLLECVHESQRLSKGKKVALTLPMQPLFCIHLVAKAYGAWVYYHEESYNEERCLCVDHYCADCTLMSICLSAEVVWTCLPFIRSGQIHLVRRSERGKKARQTQEEVGRQHQGMDRFPIRHAPEGSEEQRKKWRKLVVKSSVVPQRPPRLRD